MNKKRLLFPVLCSLVLAAALNGCGNKAVQTTEATVAAQTEPTVAETEAVATEETFADPNIIAVKTPYGKLYYQEQWAEFMKVVQLTEGENLTVRFAAEINGMEYLLFTLDIGAGEGDLVGIITDADGVQRDVFLSVEENIEHAELSQDEQNRLYAMQEEINFVLENLE